MRIRVLACLTFLGVQLAAPHLALAQTPPAASASTSGEPPGFHALLHGLTVPRWTFTGGLPGAKFSIDQLDVDWQDPRFVFAPVAGGGYYLSTDGGRSWSVHDTPAGGLHSAAIWHHSRGRWIFVAGDAGLWRSTDDGRSWNLVSPESGMVTIVSDTILFSVSRAVRRAVLPDESWHSYGIPEDGYSLVDEWSHGGHETILATPITDPHSTFDHYHLWVKQDGGPFVRAAYPGGPFIRDFLPIPGTATVLMAGDAGTGFEGGIWRSTDAGMTWSVIRVPERRTGSGGPLVKDGEHVTDTVCCPSFFGLHGLRLAGRLVIFANAGAAGGAASYDQGLTWHALDDSVAGVPGVADLAGMTVAPSADGLVFLATSAGSTLWRQVLPGVRAAVALAGASDASLEDSDGAAPWPVLAVPALVVTAAGWSLRRRRRVRANPRRRSRYFGPQAASKAR